MNQIEIHDYDLPDVSVYRNHAGLRDWTAHWASAWESWEMDPAQYLDARESVVMLFTMRTTAKGSGIPLERKEAILFRLDDGRITRIDYYNDQHQARVESGLPK